jgi:hypothetical protein
MSALAGIPNPFEGTVVADAWSPTLADVTDIHRSAFEHCLRALESVARGKSDSILINGPAGSGKTHLLARLQAHLSATASAAPDGTLHCVFVSVKLQTNAELLWQLVRRRLTSDLLRKQQGITQLERLVAHQLAAARGNTPRHWVMALRVLPDADGDSVSEYVEEVASRLELGRELRTVVEHLVKNRFVTDARAWLAGESLPESVLHRLGLGPDEQEDREEAARQIVTALCRLAGETLPIVLSFDQIEALQRSPDDRDALFRFGRMAADLSEADPNVLLISAIQSAYVDLLNASVRQADRERIFKRRSVLDPLEPAQVEALVSSRLDSIEALRALRAARPGERFHPFDAAFVASLAQTAQTSPCVPRRVIAAAAAAFEKIQRDQPLPPIKQAQQPPDDFFADAFMKRRAAALAEHKPGEGRDTVLHGLPLLFSLRGAKASAQRIPGVDLVLPTAVAGAEPLAIAVCNETNMKSMAARLRQLVQGGEGLAGLRVRIVRDPRLAVSSGAKKTQEYLSELEKRGAHLVQPSVEALAALEALRSLLSDARAGDLAVRGEALGEATVAAWLARHLDDALLDLCDALEGPSDRQVEPTEGKLARRIDEIMLRRFVARLDAVAGEAGCSDDEALSAARKSSDRLSVLEGPPAVIFVHVPPESLDVEAAS